MRLIDPTMQQWLPHFVITTNRALRWVGRKSDVHITGHCEHWPPKDTLDRFVTDPMCERHALMSGHEGYRDVNPQHLIYTKADKQIHPGYETHEWAMSERGRYGHGLCISRTVILPALHLALLMGAKRIELIGVDCMVAEDGANHFCGDYITKDVNPRLWVKRQQQLRDIADKLDEFGATWGNAVELICWSPYAKLKQWDVHKWE